MNDTLDIIISSEDFLDEFCLSLEGFSIFSSFILSLLIKYEISCYLDIDFDYHEEKYSYKNIYPSPSTELGTLRLRYF